MPKIDCTGVLLYFFILSFVNLKTTLFHHGNISVLFGSYLPKDKSELVNLFFETFLNLSKTISTRHTLLVEGVPNPVGSEGLTSSVELMATGKSPPGPIEMGSCPPGPMDIGS